MTALKQVEQSEIQTGIAELKAFFPPNPKQYGLLAWVSETGVKRVETVDNSPVTDGVVSKHLTGQIKSRKGDREQLINLTTKAFGWWPGLLENGVAVTGCLCVDFDAKDYIDQEPDAMYQAITRLVEVAECHGFKVYRETSTSGKGCHVWIFLEQAVPLSEARAIGRGFARLGGLHHAETIEVFPKGDDLETNWIIIPYARALHPKAEKSGLGTTYLVTPDGEPIPVYDLSEWIERTPNEILKPLLEEGLKASTTDDKPATGEPVDLAPEALPMLLEATLNPAKTPSRHDSIIAWLNLARRCGGDAEMLEHLKSREVFEKWGIAKDGSRSYESWCDEVGRWAKAKRSKHERGIPYLIKQGFTIPELPKNPEQTDPRRVIVNNRHMRDITDDSIKVLQASNEPVPYLFIRSSMLCRVDDQARIEPLTVPSLKGIMDRAGDYVKVETTTDDKGNPKKVYLPARPPSDVANDILHLQRLPFPQLDAVATVPQVLPGGVMLSENGYDTETRTLLYAPGLDNLQPDMPLEQARELIVNDLLGDFPFNDEGGLAHSVAMLLQSFLIQLITGACPLFLIDAPTRGTGKTLLYKVIARVVLGGHPAIMTLTRDGDELDKRITASLLEGDVMLVFDNVPTKLESDKLAAVITTRRYRGRRLGKTEMLTVANNATIVATGNNVEVSDEMARRIMPIRLDAGVERPEEGRQFKHDDLEGWVEANRALLVSACLSLINAWVKAGMPLAQETIGSFESWAQVMGGILNHAEIPGLLSGRERFADAADQETYEWRTLTHFWYQTFGQRAVNATEIFDDVIKPNNLLLDLWAGRSALSAKQRIGRALTTRRDRVFGNYHIRSAGQDPITRNASYRLEKREQAYPHKKHPKHPDGENNAVQDRKTDTGVMETETPANTRKHPETPGGNESETPRNTRKHPENTQAKNTVQDGKTIDSQVFRVFQRGVSPIATPEKIADDLTDTETF